MLSNQIIETQISSLLKKRSDVQLRREEVIGMIKELGVSKQAIWKQKKGLIDKVPEETVILRNCYSKEIQDLEKKIIELNQQVTELRRQQDSEVNKSLISIFNEMFTSDQLSEIKREAARRAKGEPPLSVGIDVANADEIKKTAAKYKQLAQKQIDDMLAFRVLLTDVIEKGCKKFGETEFMQIISPLNRQIMPIQELNKIKMKYYLKMKTD